MLALRLARGAHPLVLLRRLLVAAASGGVGFLLLCTLGYALGHPEESTGSVRRLLWCLPPLAATVYFAVMVARTDPGTNAPRAGLSAVGLGPVRLAALAAVSTAVSCTLGSAFALLFFLHLRGDLSGLPFDGAGAELLAAGQPLPVAGVLTLLCVVPVTAAAACALALRPRAAGRPDDPAVGPAAPSGLPWGVALVAAGLAVETYTSRGRPGEPLTLPGRLDAVPAGILAGWALTAVGLALAGPGLTYLSGRLLQSVRPGAVRLLAGRVLMDEARRIGHPLGVVCAVASAAIAATTLYDTGSAPARFGPLTGLGVALVLTCTAATLLMSALEAKQSRAAAREALLGLGAPRQTLRTAAALRAASVLTVFTPVTLALAALAAFPLTS
ncbi:hypothetical protein AR457_09845 [Streptomyces agglomeratus]|uniref:Uncharacterized protein n=1 Tax=Streptomyces agglomeratus TaxID=285458 RepID=A0A1E5P5C5_9ACTN|nr:hypothetical protein [Streptomyces agglomeratus]OEJ24768.1 hypothetical protein AS594_10030 [Streptomyces agglomeratus]OEJ41263.1 hypothetical protein BGK70_26825 [Streptomyces agglomeratus]OEJ44360.1 hypothetical protein AR457_09845 [Streptomyces agglomeratus]OEJ53762.1 hypothetical protein BGK72_26175 [Streptomyces agglomeratus]OEJ61131.1 hypothetical protein BGM19_27060 [Streptomyces agglomeratus]